MLSPVDGPSAAEELDGTRVVTLPAEIDLDNAEDVHAALTRALAAGATVLVADMAATGYCTLEGLHAL
jgi:anti-anti-sigma regulatory factor